MIDPPLSFTGARWDLAEPHPEQEAALVAALGVEPVLARCLAVRGYGEPARAQAFLEPSWGQLNDPTRMAGLEQAVARIQRAVAAGERTRIITDYDVDGTTSALVLRATLGLLGMGEGVDHHIPDRMGDGYGLSCGAVEAAAEAGVSLLLAADLGVRDHRAVALARSRGMDVIICDHHLVLDEGVPDAIVLCPGRPGCDYPNTSLAACGVCFTLARALLAGHPRRDAMLRSMLKVVGLGTVADVVDLSPLENRAIVALGLEALSRPPHAPGLRALLEAAGCAGRPLVASDLGFRLGPRINAAGRLAHASLALELLQARDLDRARALAQELEGLNRQRQRLQESLTQRLLERALPDPGGEPRCAAFPVFGGSESEGCHRGVVGIVAGKLREALQRPVAVAAIADGQAIGSVRSVPGVDAVAALGRAEHLLSRFGGHKAAAGFSLAAEHLPALEQALSAYVVREIPPADLIPVRRADILTEQWELGEQAARALERMEPCGRGNPRPRMLVEGVRIDRVRRVRQHIFFELGGGQGVWWSGAQHTRALLDGPVDLLGSLGPDRRDGFARPMLTVEDARRSPGAG